MVTANPEVNTSCIVGGRPVIQVDTSQTQDPIIPLGQDALDSSSVSIVEEDDPPTPMEVEETAFFKLYNDDKMVIPTDRVPFLLGMACTGLVDGFTLSNISEPPFLGKKAIRPTKRHLIIEIWRLFPLKKNLKNTNFTDMIESLTESNEDALNALEVQYIISKFNEVKSQFEKEAAV